MKQPKCYANKYDNCIATMSKEHCLSHVILDTIDPSGLVKVVGAPWLNGKGETISTASLAAKVLCSGHNNELSVLDREAGRLFKAVCETENILLSPRKNPRHADYKFDGNLLERWCLKVLCGYAASGNFQTGNVIPPPPNWVDVVFGKAPFTEGHGMYYSWDEGQTVQTVVHHAGVFSLSKNGAVCGVRVVLGVNSFSLVMQKPDHVSRLSSNSLVPMNGYRPIGIFYTDGISRRRLHLSWSVPGDQKVVMVSFRV
jgi:hypothetical protein